MLKYIYKIIILFGIFVAAIFYFGRTIREEAVIFDSTVEMGHASFPMVQLKSEAGFINRMYGYSGNIDANLMRDCITPLDSEQVLQVYIQENESEVKKVNYEIRDTYSYELLESGSYNVLEKEDNYKTLRIKIKQELESQVEYSAKITIVTVTGKKINYYTRLKRVNNAKLEEKLKFITTFHDSILDKKKANRISAYLEPNALVKNSSLSEVTINSNLETVSFAGLNPKIVSEVIPAIKEIHDETASIELSYYMSAKTPAGDELYLVKENYRVKWTESRMYLLRYNRTMETMFNINSLSLPKNELKLGITGNSDTELISSGDENKICFVRERALWYYNLKENKVVLVFRFMEESSDFIRDSYDQHNIRILKMTEEGDIDFLVYGYMNRGDYEGRVAMILYHYYASADRIEEVIYIPTEVPYQLLKEDLDEFSYLNQESVFYFSIDNTVYSYNIITKNQETIVSNLESSNLLLCKEGRYIAWQEEADPMKSKSILLMDLETGKQRKIEAGDNKSIKLLGKIDQNIIYGTAKIKDITKGSDGNTLIPLNKVTIEDREGRKLKEYQKKNYYVTSVNVDKNSVELNRVRRVNDKEYAAAKSDSILTKAAEEFHSFEVTSRVTDKLLKEFYIALPSGNVIDKIPKTVYTVNTVITVDTALHLKKMDSAADKYYVYANGRIINSSYNAGTAISAADITMGSVVNREQQFVWERGARPIRYRIDSIDTISTSAGVSSITASILMVLKYNMVNTSANSIQKQQGAVDEILSDRLKKTGVNMSGASLEQILYHIGNQRPVIAMKDSKNAVLIIGYDELNVTWIDPLSAKINKATLKEGSKMFEEAGNIFYSYLE